MWWRWRCCKPRATTNQSCNFLQRVRRHASSPLDTRHKRGGACDWTKSTNAPLLVNGISHPGESSNPMEVEPTASLESMERCNREQNEEKRRKETCSKTMVWMMVETSRSGDRCTSSRKSGWCSPFRGKKTKEQKQLPPDVCPWTACMEQKENSCFASYPFVQHCKGDDCCTPGICKCVDQGAHVPSAGKNGACQAEIRTKLQSGDNRPIRSG